MPKRASPMNPKDARNAGKPTKGALVHPGRPVKCTTPFVRNAADPAGFLSGRQATVPFTAASASKRNEGCLCNVRLLEIGSSDYPIIGC
jgi:hypothetical protein